jgi:hypothetical protein
MIPYVKASRVITDYDEKSLEYAPTYATKQKDIIKLIDYYWVSKYQNGDKDALGFLKPFYNVIINPTEVASKMIDIDTKDIKVIAEDGASYYPAWFFSKELRVWMKEKGFGKLLNEIIYNLPKYGSVVLKKSGKNISLVPLQNLRNNTLVRKLEDDVICEEHIETISAFKKHSEDWGQDVIDKALDAWGKGIIEAKWYEAYGDFSDVDGNKGENYYIFTDQGIDLHKAKVDCPYKEVHWDKLEGRWMGRGQVERLFEAQIQQNKVANMKSQSLNWTSKRVWQTKDDGVARNLMTDVQNGDILRVNSEVTPVATEERNLSAYAEEESRWDLLAERLGFSYDVMSGKRAPAGTTLGATVLQTQMAGGYFDLKREDIGLFLKDVIFDWIIPMFKKDKRISHKIMISEFSEDELITLRGLLTQFKVNKAILDYITKSNQVPSEEEIEALKQIVAIKVKGEKEIEIPESFYENLKYKIDIVITGEQIDLASKLTLSQMAMQLIGSNPTILQDPNTKKWFMQFLEAGGINPVQLESVENTQEQINTAQVSGSMAKPRGVNAQPITTQSSTKI